MGSWMAPGRFPRGLWTRRAPCCGSRIRLPWQEKVSLTLFVPPSTPPGEYTLHFVVYNAATQEVAADAAGRPATPLATIKVVE